MQRKLKILLFASALFMLAGGLFGPIYAVFVEEIGGDLLTAGGAYAAFSIAAPQAQCRQQTSPFSGRTGLSFCSYWSSSPTPDTFMW